MLKLKLTMSNNQETKKFYNLNVLILKQEYKYVNLNETINSIIWKEQGAVSYQILKHFFVIFIMLSQKVQYLQICRTYQLIWTKCLEPKVYTN